MAIDLLEGAKDGNPFPAYEALRAKGSVVWSDSLDGWVVSGYQDVKAVLLNNRDFSSRDFFDRVFGDLVPVKDGPWMIAMDPPHHGRVRSLANQAFRPADVDAMTRQIKYHIRSLLDDIEMRHGTTGEFDLCAEYTNMFPPSVIADMLGARPEDRGLFSQFITDIELGPRIGELDEDTIAQVRKRIAFMREYVEKTVEKFSAAPADNIISLLIKAKVERDRLSDLELLCLAILLLQGGSGSVGMQVSNAIYELGERRDILSRIEEDSALIGQFLEEVIRFRPAIHALPRTARSEVVVGNQAIKPGDAVFAMLASANRDPDQFDRPNEFDLDREFPGHLTFGFGHHVCIGQRLARLEATLAIEEMLKRWHIEPQNDRVDFVEHWIVSGPRCLPVRYSRRLT